LEVGGGYEIERGIRRMRIREKVLVVRWVIVVV